MSDLDSLVKGAPLPSSDGKPAGGSTTPNLSALGKEGDPLSHAPSSPSMIYLNLLILEASLRAQYLELRARRRHHTFFLILLSAWNLGFGYALFLAPREDGRGVGGSVYWGVEVAEKLCLLGGAITAILVWATGIWDRGVKWPRRWFGISNRGLRSFNCKLVILRRSWLAELVSTLAFFLTYGLFSHTASSSYRFVDAQILREVDRELNLGSDAHPTLPHHQHSPSHTSGTHDGEHDDHHHLHLPHHGRAGHEEDLAPGGDYVKLLLLAKPFSPTFRENWEIYRSAYWDRENERRALISAKLRRRDYEVARHRWGWLWWLPWHQAEIYRRTTRVAGTGSRHGTPDRPSPRHPAIEREQKLGKAGHARRGSSSSSRTPTPTLEVEDTAPVSRKSSTASNASERRRKKSASSGSGSPGLPQKRTGVEPRALTPENSSPLARESSSGVAAGRTLRHSSSLGSVEG